MRIVAPGSKVACCLAAVLMSATPAIAQSTPPAIEAAKNCLVDNTIPGDQRAALDATGLAFVQAVIEGRAEDAYEIFTSAMKHQLPADQFAQMVAVQLCGGFAASEDEVIEEQDVNAGS